MKNYISFLMVFWILEKVYVTKNCMDGKK